MPPTTELAPANPMAHLKDLQRLQREVQEDLRQRCDEVVELRERLQADYQAARDRGRTTSTYGEWREQSITQSAAAWVLACVFVRYLEDHELVDEVWLAGHGEDRFQRALDSHEAYFQHNPAHSDREYLQHVFRAVAGLPGCSAIFGEDRNPLWQLGVSGDMARALLAFFRERDPRTGHLVRPFGTGEGDTRFLGDLYQDLSENARKRYALLQTPDFVEEFILDRTLTPATEEFDLAQVRMIDPACGSGHFLLGAFHRLFKLWRDREPGGNPREWARKAAEAVHGVDLNPFAAAIARFRLLVAYLQACGLHRLRDAPDVRLHVAAGDSLIYERRVDSHGNPYLDGMDWTPEPFLQGDYDDACAILAQRYHVVVGNPPYITDKDAEHRDFVRQHYASAYKQFSLGVPFTERFFELAEVGDAARGSSAGWVGMITANSFLKREFGKKLIEEYLPRIDLTHVIDTSGAYIPGHGTPTVILFGRNRRPVGSAVRAVLGVRGEPETPADPGQGKVWRSVLELLDRPGAENEFVTVADIARETFDKHPWSLEGGGAGELLKAVTGAGAQSLGDIVGDIGRTTHTGEDSVFYLSRSAARLVGVKDFVVPVVVGEDVRDWVLAPETLTVFPYDEGEATVLDPAPSNLSKYFWPYRTNLSNRVDFGHTILERGLAWYEHCMFFPDRFRTPLSIAFAFVATHNHFVLDRGGKVFKQSAPVIKLPPGATEDQHLALCGVLNSAVACFWLRQVCHNKGATSNSGVLQDNPEKFRFEFDGTKLGQFPIPSLSESQRSALLAVTRALDAGGRELGEFSFQAFVDECLASGRALKPGMDAKIAERDRLRDRMVRWQEELDWLCYEIYDVAEIPPEAHSLAWTASPEEMPPLAADDRPYRLTQHGREASDPLTRARMDVARRNRFIGLLEKPDHKRRWFRSAGAYDAHNLDDSMILQQALRSWLLDRLETPKYWGGAGFASAGGGAGAQPELTSCARLADLAGRDPEFHQVAALYRGREDYDRLALVKELVLSEAVPYLPALRYKPSGIAKRKQWEDVWELQRREDAGENVGPIPVPPKYTSADFLDATCWRLRGKLDVPKERFVLYPKAEREADPTPVVGWAGWNHLEQAQALAAYYLRARDEGFPTERLVPLLAGLEELLPWIHQWHPQVDPGMGLPMGEFFSSFVSEQMRELGLS